MCRLNAGRSSDTALSLTRNASRPCSVPDTPKSHAHPVTLLAVTKAAGILRFYQQGKLVQQVAAPLPHLVYGPQQLTIGRGGGASDTGLEADLAAVMLWNTALNGAEVASLNSLYAARFSKAGLPWC